MTDAEEHREVVTKCPVCCNIHENLGVENYMKAERKSFYCDKCADRAGLNRSYFTLWPIPVEDLGFNSEE